MIILLNCELDLISEENPCLKQQIEEVHSV